MSPENAGPLRSILVQTRFILSAIYLSGLLGACAAGESASLNDATSLAAMYTLGGPVSDWPRSENASSEPVTYDVGDPCMWDDECVGEGMVCVEAVCRLLSDFPLDEGFDPVGSACTSHEDCGYPRNDLRCRDGICSATTVRLGESCAEPFECPLNAFCDPQTLICVEEGFPRGLRGACSTDGDCGEDLYCHIVGCSFGAGCGLCTRVAGSRGVGESCEGDKECGAGLLCVRNTCIVPHPGAPGDECNVSEDCQPDLICLANFCQSSSDEPRGEGEACIRHFQCSAPLECIDGFCSAD